MQPDEQKTPTDNKWNDKGADQDGAVSVWIGGEGAMTEESRAGYYYVIDGNRESALQKNNFCYNIYRVICF